MGSRLVCSKVTAGLLVLAAALVIAVAGLIAALVKLQESDGTIARGNNMADEGWATNYRIPEDTVPVHYELYLHPHMEAGVFNGKVYVHVEVTKPRDYLVVHVKNLMIGKSKLYNGTLTMDDPTKEPTQQAVQTTRSFEYAENEFYVMTANGGFAPGMYTWYISFSGSLTENIVGFYRSVYKTSSGEERLMATSKFQPTYARRAFPCFDEPSFKSTFRVMLVRPSGGNYKALSNMDVEKEVADTPEVGRTTVYFNKSVRMVTYLACFIVCDFEYTEMTTDDGVSFRVYARQEQVEANSTDYSLRIGTDISNYFVDYFGVKYPLPKQDMIAIPDFVSGAMEHWGLITFREVNLLYKDETSSAANKQRVATVVSHELAHMWFGNLVTLKWWDDLWLNEGFASYMEFKGVDQFETNWDMDTQFIASDLTGVMELDAQLSSHPIVQEVHHPDEITQLFDIISYNKGASVLRMLEDFLSPEVFRRGVSNFLKKFEYENAVTQDLWDTLQGVWTDNAGLNVGHVMDTWTKQMGYPVIRVQQNAAGNFELDQTRFLADPNARSTTLSPYDYKWDVPISYRYWANGKIEQGRTWLRRSQQKLEIPRPDGLEWMKVNNDFKGYYIVNYDEESWSKFAGQFADAAERQKFTAADRANLISDAFMLAAAGKLSYAVPLELAKSLNLETHAVPWLIARYALEDMDVLLKSTSISDAYQTFVRSITTPLFDGAYGFDDPGNDDVLAVQLRNSVIGLACAAKYEPCIEAAEQRFETWLNNDGSRLSPNLRNLVFKYGMTERLGTADNWDKVFQKYLNEGDPQERVAYLNGLANTPNEEQLRQYIELAKDQRNVRRQDFFTVIGAISRNPAGTNLAWDFYRNEWESFLVPTFTLNDRYLGSLVKTLTSTFATPERKAEMEEFFAKYPEAGAGTAARRDALEAVQNKILWLERSVDDISGWLNSS